MPDCVRLLVVPGTSDWACNGTEFSTRPATSSVPGVQRGNWYGLAIRDPSATACVKLMHVYI